MVYFLVTLQSSPPQASAKVVGDKDRVRNIGWSIRVRDRVRGAGARAGAGAGAGAGIGAGAVANRSSSSPSVIRNSTAAITVAAAGGVISMALSSDHDEF